MSRIKSIGVLVAGFLSTSLALAQSGPIQPPVGPVSAPSAPVQVPSAPPSNPSSTPRTQLTPEEMRAAESLNAQVAQQYLQTQGAQPQVAPPPAKPRSNIKPPPESITIKPGVNAVFGIAEGHLNRLVTPFKNPVVKTTAVAATSIEKNIVYVSTNNAEPVGFYIHDASDPLNAISVTMVPSDIPPISVTLILQGYATRADDGGNAVAGDAKLAKGWETGAPFVDAIKNTFRTLAKGQIPDGYSFETLPGVTPLMPRCGIPGLRIEPKQLLTGYNLQVIVSKVTNFTDATLDVDERACEGDSVVAVAAWPQSSLAPHAVTELYVAIRKVEPPSQDTVRPSLVSQGAL